MGALFIEQATTHTSGNWEELNIMEFPINTQEEFDAAIQKRLDREGAKFEAKYKDFDVFKEKAKKYDELLGQDYPGQIAALQGQLSQAQEQLSAAQEKIGAHDKVVADLTARATSAETANLRAKVAHAHNIPFELADRLAGATEEELGKDAENFAKFVSLKPETAPLASTEPGNAGTKEAGYAQLLGGLMRQTS